MAATEAAVRLKTLGAALLVLAGTSAWAEVDFFDEAARLPAVEAAIAVAAEASAAAAVAQALNGVEVTRTDRPKIDRLTDLMQRQAAVALRKTARDSFAIAMSEEQAAALVDLHATEEGAALIEAAMLVALSLREAGGDSAAFELERAEQLLESIKAK